MPLHTRYCVRAEGSAGGRHSRAAGIDGAGRYEWMRTASYMVGEDRVGQAEEYNASATTAVILPYEKTEEHTIEPLGQIADKPVYSFMKRTFDIVASAVALCILLIPMVIIGLGCALRRKAVRCLSRSVWKRTAGRSR